MRKAHGLCALLALGGLALRLAIAARAIDTVDRLFVSDDAYYTLAIARSLARGLGPAADGVHLTNGFQPLLAFLTAPIFWVTRDADAPLRAVLVFLAVIDAALAYAVGEVARRLATRDGERAAVVATAMWAASPVAISYALGGLETSLALFLTVLVALAWSSARARDRRDPRSLGRYAAAGALGGLALLARIDVALFVALLFAWEFVRGRRSGVVVAGLATAAVVAPWWAYELAHFGTVVPTSGAAVRQLVAVHRALYLTVPKQVGWALGAVFEAVLTRAVDWRDLFPDVPVLALVVSPVVAGGMLFAATRARATRPGPAAAPLRALVVYGVVAWGFYALYVPAIWFFPRYLAPVHVACTVLVASLVGARPPAWPPAGRWGAAWMVLAGVTLLSLATSVAFAIRTPEGTVEVTLHGAKGYREPARAIVEAAPRGAVIGSLQSGALGYYAGWLRPDVRVVNLDGVVDEEAAVAFREHRLAAFARARGVTHLADWRFNLDAFLRYGGDPRLSAASYRELAAARAQGSDRFTLEEVVWP